MKKLFSIFLILIVPVALFAQDTIALKRQAEIMAKAAVKGDYKTLVNYMYPRFVQMAGGKEEFYRKASAGIAQVKARGVDVESAIIGTPGKFYNAGKEIHCLVPEIITIKLPNGRITSVGYLLAISGDGGKNWSFLDLNKATIPKIPELFPHFNPKLKIPEPKQPVLQ